jgi:predicted CXXCH cytochrome family protein
MKRKNYKRKLISYIVFWSVVLSSLLFNSPNNIVVSASGVPEIKLLTPVAGAVFNVSMVEFTGTISDDLTTADKLPVQVFEQSGESEQPIDITGEGTLSITTKENYADFTFSNNFSEGVHTLTFIVTDGDGVSAKVERSFTIEAASTKPVGDSTPTTVIDTENPVQPSTEVIDTNPETTNPVTTSEADESLASAEGSEATPPPFDETGKRPYLAEMFLIPKDAQDEYVPGREVPNSFLPAEDMTRVPLGYKILIDIRSTEPLVDLKTQPLLTSFGDITGTEELLKSTVITENLKAYVYTFTPDQEFSSKTLYDIYLNPKFSTESGIGIIPRFLKFTTVTQYEDFQFPADKEDNGKDYRDNDYVHGPFSVVTNACSFCHSTHNGTNGFLVKGEKGSNENDMCMACHDGTGSPKIEENSKHSKHYTDSSVSCSSCHDPHNPGTKENPNSLHPKTGTTAHTYKKTGTATGESSDYSLCFSCHDGGEASNINQYYTEGIYKSESGHNIQATTDSGSNLNGQLPCAECHETHGATNTKMLRSDLGNVKLTGQKPETDQLDDNWFNKTTDEWDAEAQRKFCLSCHNGKTILYGKTGKAIYDIETGDSIHPENDGHNRVSEKTCSECHSTGNSFTEAAHAPKRITP